MLNIAAEFTKLQVVVGSCILSKIYQGIGLTTCIFRLGTKLYNTYICWQQLSSACASGQRGLLLMWRLLVQSSLGHTTTGIRVVHVLIDSQFIYKSIQIHTYPWQRRRWMGSQTIHARMGCICMLVDYVIEATP